VVLPEFLPFFMQSDLFMERAQRISVGSLSPTINWKTLAKEEFALPPLEEQRRIARLLRAYSRLTFELQESAACLDACVGSTMLDLLHIRNFDPIGAKAHIWPMVALDQVCTIASGNGEPIANPSGDALYFKVADFNRNVDPRALNTSESFWYHPKTLG